MGRSPTCAIILSSSYKYNDTIIFLDTFYERSSRSFFLARARLYLIARSEQPSIRASVLTESPSR